MKSVWIMTMVIKLVETCVNDTIVWLCLCWEAWTNDEKDELASNDFEKDTNEQTSSFRMVKIMITQKTKAVFRGIEV
jgi:hypothetical protein